MADNKTPTHQISLGKINLYLDAAVQKGAFTLVQIDDILNHLAKLREQVGFGEMYRKRVQELEERDGALSKDDINKMIVVEED